MMLKAPRSPVSLWWRSAWRSLTERTGPGQSLASRLLLGAALILGGATAGLAVGQHLSNRTAHRTGACVAIKMAVALGYLDVDQERRVRHALTTAVNPDVDLFSGGRPSLREVCVASGG